MSEYSLEKKTLFMSFTVFHIAQVSVDLGVWSDHR